MDSRKDEQERGITMKSSAVAVHYQKGSVYFILYLDFFYYAKKLIFRVTI